MDPDKIYTYTYIDVDFRHCGLNLLAMRSALAPSEVVQTNKQNKWATTTRAPEHRMMLEVRGHQADQSIDYAVKRDERDKENKWEEEERGEEREEEYQPRNSTDDEAGRKNTTAWKNK